MFLYVFETGEVEWHDAGPTEEDFRAVDENRLSVYEFTGMEIIEHKSAELTVGVEKCSIDATYDCHIPAESDD